MYVNRESLAQKENEQDHSCKENLLNRETQCSVKIGDEMKCPECETMAKVVWISQDKKTMGVKCHASHREVCRPKSKFGATKVPSTKTKRNIVFLMPVG